MSQTAMEPTSTTTPTEDPHGQAGCPSWQVWSALALVSVVSGWLTLLGIQTGLPSQERLEISLGGPEAIDRAEADIRQVLESKIADRSEFVAAQGKPEMARLSPYFDQVRSFHPDEQYILKTLARMARDRDVHPRSYIYGPIFFYQVGAGLAIAKAVGALPKQTDVLYYLRRPWEFAPMYLNARLMCAAFGVAAVAVTFWIGYRLGGIELATVGALLLGCVPLMTLAGKFIKPDTPAVFWSALALWFALSAASKTRWRDYLLSGACVGLAMGSKYPAALAGMYLATFHAARRWAERKTKPLPGREDGMLVAAGGAAVLAFVATNPACVLDAKVFWSDFEFISRVLRTTSFAEAVWDGIISYGQDAFLYTMGPAAFLAVLAGVAVAVARPSRVWLGLLPTVALFFVFACRGRPGSDAYLLPVFPALALLGARAMLRISPLSLRWGIVGLVILVTLSYSLAYGVTARAENARMIAARWINERVEPGSTIGTAKYPVGYRVPMISPERYRLLSAELDPAARAADYFLDSSFEWSGATWRDRLVGRAVTGGPPGEGYRVAATFERVPRALFGLLPLRRDHMLTPYIEVVAPRIVIYEREKG